MPELIPEEAVQAAGEAIANLFASARVHGVAGHMRMLDDDVVARLAVEAAAPLIAEQARAEERREVAEEIRSLGDWPDGYTAFAAFLARHGLDRRPSDAPPLFSAFLKALAEEVGGDVLRQAREADRD